ncbi:unnamed protein product [Acanthoscelides obtectus]|uniref:Uncharacterized protein n=1 Tax=Acanthoscelides obtectus TaxID=200917 RepID=A0A9P0L9T6_ACAOB|nr:unnamed protein product [Acanthoscelides obtectus]CAK1649592.1 hypothetical protein AOBTE_LOCUS16320 [Acanthoscelides obtectus]
MSDVAISPPLKKIDTKNISTSPRNICVFTFSSEPSCVT